VGQQAREAAAAAQRQDVAGHLKELADPYPWLIPTANKVAFAVCLILLLVNLTIMTKRRRFTRG
jgi:hypothetical protein